MADGVFNISKGRVVEMFKRVDNNDPSASAIKIVLLKTVEADGTIQDYDTLDAMLTAGGGTANVEADFTNYARKTLVDTDILVGAPDDTNNRYEVGPNDQTWTSAGGATNNTLAKLIVCYDGDTAAGTDADIIPLTFHDFVVTTDGTDLIADFNALGSFRAT